jgi:hypothetical protein
MQDEYMAHDTAITVRIPAPLKRHIELRARHGHRSLSAQVLHDLSAAASSTPATLTGGRFIGLFAGSPIPTDADFAAIRAQLWGQLGRRSPSRV